MNKVRELLLRYLQKMPFFPVRAMWAIYAYAAFMFSSLLIYISMILVLWNRTGLEPIEDMKEFCEVLFSSAAVRRRRGSHHSRISVRLSSSQINSRRGLILHLTPRALAFSTAANSTRRRQTCRAPQYRTATRITGLSCRSKPWNT